jgi:DNA-binding transcriptional LysR family regulator
MASIAAVDALDVSALRLFLAVVELGSVSKAATRHGLAQPSATAKLQKLERQLGVQLLDRGPSGSAATAAGVRLAPGCADLVASAVALVASGEELRDAQRRLTVATTRHVAEHFLPGWIAAAEIHDVVVDLYEADTRSVAQAVRSGEAALGFTDGPAAPLGLRSALVASEEIVAVVGRRHPWFARRRAVSGAALASATVLVGRAGSGTLDVVEQAIAARGLSADGNRVGTAGSIAARLGAISGVGVAFLPRCQIAADLVAGLLSAVALRDIEIVQPIRAVWRGGRPSERPARAVLDAATAAGRG